MARVFDTHPRGTCDLQMLDRVSAGLVKLPNSTYDLVLLLVDPTAGTSISRRGYLDRSALTVVTQSMRSNATLRIDDGSGLESREEKEAVLSGLVAEGTTEFRKPDFGDDEGVVRLPFVKANKSKVNKMEEIAVSAGIAAPVAAPVGVGFINGDDDLDMLDGDEDDDELIDENELLTEEEKSRKLDIRM